MKIVMMADRLVLGGLETHMVTFINELLRRNHDILLCTEFASADIISQIRSDGYGFQHVNGFNKWSAGVKKFQADIIQAHPFAAIVYGIRLAVRYDLPLIITMHGFYDAGLHQTVDGISVLDKSSRIIAVDHGVADFLKSDMPGLNKISVIYNGISLETFGRDSSPSIDPRTMGLDPQYPTIAAISRMDDDKTAPILQLIRCLGNIASGLGGINLVIVGDGNMLAVLKNEAEKISGTDSINIAFPGRCLNVVPYMTMADLILACDRAAMESMACGRPVLAANGSGFADLICPANYQEILGFRRGYAPLTDAELSARVTMLLQSPGLLKQASSSGPDVIRQNFDIRCKVDELESLYGQFVNSPSSQALNTDLELMLPPIRINVNTIRIKR